VPKTYPVVTRVPVATRADQGFDPAAVRRVVHQAHGSSAATSCPATQRGASADSVNPHSGTATAATAASPGRTP
jgi:hypothetical protein